MTTDQLNQLVTRAGTLMSELADVLSSLVAGSEMAGMPAIPDKTHSLFDDVVGLADSLDLGHPDDSYTGHEEDDRYMGSDYWDGQESPDVGLLDSGPA